VSQEEVLLQIADHLQNAGIPYTVAGSHRSTFYSHPWTTNDVDFVIDPTP
jgi:hypothetical protein